MEDFLLGCLYGGALLYNYRTDVTRESKQPAFAYMSEWWRWVREHHADWYWDNDARGWA